MSRLRLPLSRMSKSLLAESHQRVNLLSPMTRQIQQVSTLRSNFDSMVDASTSRSSSTEVQRRALSTLIANDEEDYFGPMGELFELQRTTGVNQNWIGKEASIRRVFGSEANDLGLLTCGGEELARHASFDPDYSRARGWIQNRAIGHAVLSPVLISGLVGALVEAAFPQSVPINSSMHQRNPLIVGQEVCARVEVVRVKTFSGVSRQKNETSLFGGRQNGNEIELLTEVVRSQDNELIAEGIHSVFIPDYLSR